MLTQKLVLSYGSKVLIQFVQIVASIVVARIAGPTVLGTVAFGLAFVSVFAFVADLGIGSAHIKLVSEGQDLGRCISTFSVLKVLNTFLFFLVVLGAFFVQKVILNVKFESNVHEVVIVVTLFAVAIHHLLYIPTRTFAARTEQAKHDIPEFVRILIYQGLRVFVVILGFKAVALALGNLVSTILVIPLVLYLFKDYPREKFDRNLASKYLKISLPILLIGISTNVIHYLDKVVLQYFTNSEQVGYYAVGYRIGGLIFMIANSVGLLFFPLFSKAASAGDFPYIKRTIEKFERFSFLFIMPVVIFVSLYADSIIRLLLGNQYLEAIPVMALVNFAMLILVLNMPYGNVITGMGLFKLAAILNIINLFFFVALIFIFPNPRFLNLGASGMALAILLSNLLLGLLYRFFAKQRCQILDLNAGFKFAVFGVLNYFIFNLLYTYLSVTYEAGFRLSFALVYFVTTYVALFLLGWIKKQDLDNLRELLNIRKIRDYVREEINS